MMRTPVQRASDETVFTLRIKRGGPTVAVLLPILLLAALAVARAATLGAGPLLPAGASLPSDALGILAGAADRLDAATVNGAPGYRFEISQTSTITARPDGPRIEVPDPEDPHKSIGTADEYLFYSLIERGMVTPAGFWSELRVGPQPGDQPDFERAELRRSALVKDGVAWRNDRDGWYQADGLPGIGLDPETAALLPRLLREATEPTITGEAPFDGSSLVMIDAAAKEADIPGLVASNGLDYTRLIRPIEFGFDDQGRLARIHAIALNTTMTDFDLVVDTVIVLRYDDPGALPNPDPTWRPTAAAQD